MKSVLVGRYSNNHDSTIGVSQRRATVLKRSGVGMTQPRILASRQQGAQSPGHRQGRHGSNLGLRLLVIFKFLGFALCVTNNLTMVQQTSMHTAGSSQQLDTWSKRPVHLGASLPPLPTGQSPKRAAVATWHPQHPLLAFLCDGS